MAKDPAFLFYPGDWIAGTMHLNFEEKGAYMELLMLQFNVGHMTSHMIGRMLGQDMDKLWSNISDKFEVDGNGHYYNARLEEEKNRRKAYTDSRRNNKKGKNQHSNKEKKVGHMTSHMENEDVNENIDSNKGEKKEIIMPFDTPDFINAWSAWKNYKKEQFNFIYKRPSEQGALTKLSNLTDNSTEAIEIIMQSIGNGWKGLFKIKDDGNKTQSERNKEAVINGAKQWLQRNDVKESR